jgi:hypothetical protein
MLKRCDNWLCDWLDGRCYAMRSGWLRTQIVRLTLWQWSRFQSTWGHGPLISNN